MSIIIKALPNCRKDAAENASCIDTPYHDAKYRDMKWNSSIANSEKAVAVKTLISCFLGILIPPSIIFRAFSCYAVAKIILQLETGSKSLAQSIITRNILFL